MTPKEETDNEHVHCTVFHHFYNGGKNSMTTCNQATSSFPSTLLLVLLLLFGAARRSTSFPCSLWNPSHSLSRCWEWEGAARNSCESFQKRRDSWDGNCPP